MKIIRKNFDRNEGRRDRRYPLPPLVVVVEGVEYRTVNWSLGGFLISGYAKRIEEGAEIFGTLLLVTRPETIDFQGQVIRVDDPAPGNLAVRFTDLGERGMVILDRLIARRLARG